MIFTSDDRRRVRDVLVAIGPISMDAQVNWTCLYTIIENECVVYGVHPMVH